MFERFTPEARAVVELAEAEARTMHHGYIGTEHLLLGLLGGEHGIAAGTLQHAGLSAGAVRLEVRRLVADPLASGPGALERASLAVVAGGRGSGTSRLRPAARR